MTPARVEIAFWLLIFVALGAGIGIESDWGKRLIWPVTETELPAASFDSPLLAVPYTQKAPDAFLETSLRPLFVVTRRPAPPPPPPPPPETPKPTMKKGQFLLAGTTIVGGIKFAHLLEVAGGKARTVPEGTEVNGILVKEVASTGVLLTQHGDSEHLVLRKPQR